MANRRQFIQTGITLSAVSSAGVVAMPRKAHARDAAKLRLDGFVYDSRFPQAVEIAGHAGREGVRLWAISENLLDLWNDYLDVQWKKQPKAIAGVTTRGDLFFLETIAADRGMRVVYRGEHAVAFGGKVNHELSGPENLFREAKLADAPDLWAPLLGKAMANCAGHGAKLATLSLETPAAIDDERDEALYSWVIAPRARTMAV